MLVGVGRVRDNQLRLLFPLAHRPNYPLEGLLTDRTPPARLVAALVLVTLVVTMTVVTDHSRPIPKMVITPMWVLLLMLT